MPRLNVAFQEGFEGESVVLLVNGAEVHRQDGLKTRMQIGLAGKVEIDAPAGGLVLTLKLPEKGLESETTLDVPVSGETYVGISLDPDGSARFKVAAEPFRYA